MKPEIRDPNSPVGVLLVGSPMVLRARKRTVPRTRLKSRLPERTLPPYGWRAERPPVPGGGGSRPGMISGMGPLKPTVMEWNPLAGAGPCFRAC